MEQLISANPIYFLKNKNQTKTTKQQQKTTRKPSAHNVDMDNLTLADTYIAVTLFT